MFCCFFERRNVVPTLLSDTAGFFFLRAFVKSADMFQNAPLQAMINNQECCRQVRFSSAKYTKMRLRPGITGGRFVAGRKGRKGQERGEELHGRGASPTSSFLQVNQVNRSINFLRAFDSFSSGF